MKEEWHGCYRGETRFRGFGQAPKGRGITMDLQKKEIVRLELVSVISKLIKEVNVGKLICILADLQR